MQAYLGHTDDDRALSAASLGWSEVTLDTLRQRFWSAVPDTNGVRDLRAAARRPLVH
jgi:hypothetical protein